MEPQIIDYYKLPPDCNDIKITSEPKHYKLMCNTKVDNKRLGRNSNLTKSIVDACFKDNVHITCAFDIDSNPYNCYKESLQVKIGDIAHMYYGDICYYNSRHYIGKVITTYIKMTDQDMISLSEISKLWNRESCRTIMCRVEWEEIKMTPEDEYMLKNPGKNGFKVQGTILRIK
jgi:hypothetical protein